MRLPDAAGIARPLPKTLRVFWGLSVLLSVLCVGVMGANHFLFHRGFPYTWPFIPFYRCVDFWCFQVRFTHFHRLDVFSTSPAFSFRYMYPAPMGLLYEGFYLTGRHSLIVFLAVTGAAVLSSAVGLGKAMVRRGAASLAVSCFLASALVLSYPLWFEYLLGNMEICVFFLVLVAVIAFLRDQFVLAAVLLGFAISLKIFPFVYLGLLFSRKKYRECVLAIGVAIVANVASLWLMCPSLPVAYRGVQQGLAAFRNQYMLTFLPVETGFDHSLFGLLKRLLNHWFGSKMPASMLTLYLALACVAGVVLYFGWIRKLPLLNQIAALTVASILLPPTSHDYTLLYLYIPWGMLVLYALDLAMPGRRAQGLLAAFVCFAVLLSAESELIHRSGYSGQLKAFTLVVLMIVAVKHPWPAYASAPGEGMVEDAGNTRIERQTTTLRRA
jgi:hypothetical protein